MKYIKYYIAAAILGIIIGGLTLVGQKHLPINLNFLANSGAVWLVPAFFVSRASKSGRGSSAALCIVCLLLCVHSYYIFEAVMNHHEFILGRWQVIWTVVALAAGGVFGLGAYASNNGRGPLQYCGMNLLPAVFFSEGLSKLIHLGEYSHMIPAVVMVICIGVILYLAINRRDCAKKYNLWSFALLSLFGLLGHELLYRISL